MAQKPRTRPVTNVYKHGGGASLDDLKQRFPEYLVDPLRDSGVSSLYGPVVLDPTNLKVTDEHLENFSDAIVAFWKGVPSEVWSQQVTVVPDWFGKVMERDLKTD